MMTTELEWTTRRGALVCLAVAGVALAYALSNAYAIQSTRVVELDIDGWGVLVERLKMPGSTVWSLFTNPSVWRGPAVPFVFGVAYAAWRSDFAVLALNAVLFASTAGLLTWTFLRLGASLGAALAAVMAWIFYLPHRNVFGYYFAEPLIGFLSAVLFVLSVAAVKKGTSRWTAASGAAAGVLMLSRPTFALVIAGVCILIWRSRAGLRGAVLFAAAFLVVYAGWPVRNFVVYRTFIPSTTEGPMVLFQGGYAPADGLGMPDMLRIPEYRAYYDHIEALPDVERYRAWKAAAVRQILADPKVQLWLLPRKFLRFWIYLSPQHWRPSWKTTLVAAISLPLAVVAGIRRRRDLLVQLCVIWVLGLWVLHGIIYAELRYNFPVLPMLFLLAAIGVETFYRPPHAADVRSRHERLAGLTL
jgi:hypothetical protein